MVSSDGTKVSFCINYYGDEGCVLAANPDVFRETDAYNYTINGISWDSSGNVRVDEEEAREWIASNVFGFAGSNTNRKGANAV